MPVASIRLATFALFALLIFFVVSPLAAFSESATQPTTTDSIPDAEADRVLGQPNLTSNTQPAAPSATTLWGAVGVALAADGRIFVTDYLHHRVVSWPSAADFQSGAAADLVLGQPNLTSGGAATTQSRLNAPESVVLDSAGNLWVADNENHRVLRFAPPFSNGKNANLVLGQANFTSGQANRGASAAANTFWFPRGLDFDSQGRLYVADTINNRVLVFAPPFATGQAASLVIGQTDFTKNQANRDNTGPKINSLWAPTAVLLDSADNLYVADRDNNRVLRFPASTFASGMDADLVLGQPSFTTLPAKYEGCAANPAGGTLIVDANHLSEPLDLAMNGIDDLYVSDICNHRVLIYQNPASSDKTADFVFGQPDFTSGSANRGSGPAANTLNTPLGIAVTIDGTSYVADFGNNRLLAYNVNPTFSCNDVSEITTAQCDALVTLYNDTNGANWLNKTNWLNTTTPCSWYGITCVGTDVTQIVLPSNQLSGTLPSTPNPLTKLTLLDLSNNQLSGGIPQEFGSLSNLTALKLAKNALTGAIPTELGNLAKLQELYLNDNQLTGAIPASLGNITTLGYLTLNNNALTGALPATVGNLSALVRLSVGTNQLSGALPTSLGNLTTLGALYLSNNGFTGALPSNLTNLTNLNEFYFEATQLCVPATTAFQTWLTGIPNKGTSGLNCPAETPSPTTTVTPTVTSTTTPTVTSTATPTPSVTPQPGSGDAYETDNACPQARAIATNGNAQPHTFHQTADADWVSFDATATSDYRIEVKVPDASPADVNLEVYATCEGVPTEKWTASFSPGVRLDFKAQATGKIYLRLANYDATVAGNHVTYELSVRSLSAAPAQSALILLAGRLRGADRLQKNIHNITGNVYRIFQQNDYTDANIYYLATDSALPGYDAAASKEGLRAAITQWAVDKVKNNGVLTLYMVDHGHPDLFYIDELAGQRVSPSELDGWLSELEAAAPGVTINVIIEACQSGSFIEKPTSISKAGRMVITSSNAKNDAKASQNGAYFSDHLLTQLAQGFNLAASFSSAQAVAKQVFSLQEAWLDADGNGIANEFGDATIAAQRGFAYAGTFGEEWPPHIFQAQAPISITNFSGVIQADVRDDAKVSQVWAVVYPPDYTPPATGQELQAETLPSFNLTATGNGDFYAGIYPGFTQQGTYRIVIHAADNNALVATPRTILVEVGSRVYLPLVVR